MTEHKPTTDTVDEGITKTKLITLRKEYNTLISSATKMVRMFIIFTILGFIFMAIGFYGVIVTFTTQLNAHNIGISTTWLFMSFISFMIVSNNTPTLHFIEYIKSLQQQIINMEIKLLLKK